MADTEVSKISDPKGREGSIPSPGTRTEEGQSWARKTFKTV